MSKPIYVEDLVAAQKWLGNKLGTAPNGIVRMTLDDLIWFLQTRPDSTPVGEESNK